MRRTRRDFLRQSASATLAAPLFGAAAARVQAAREDEKLPVAAVVTVYQKQSHADVIVGKILEGYQQQGGPGPGLRLASLYIDQEPSQEMSRALAEKHAFRRSPTIADALTLGTDRLQVAGVLSIGEHGNYPYTPATRQHMYPRRRFFDEIVDVFRRCGQTVPVFNDKHLSYRWEDAEHMVRTARDVKFPLLAGSSLPVAWRYPPLELPLECEIEAALAIGYGGLEAYGFHALETLQCMIERRRGGETGVDSVQAVQHDALRAAAQTGAWSRDLFRAALQTLPGTPQDSDEWPQSDNSAAYLMQHRDGLRSAVVMASGLARHFAFAVKLKGRAEPLATWFKLQEDRPYGHFAYLVRAIEHTIRTGTTAYPVERTLLTTGILDRAMHSLADGGKKFESPELRFAYQPREWPFANSPSSTLELPND